MAHSIDPIEQSALRSPAFASEKQPLQSTSEQDKPISGHETSDSYPSKSGSIHGEESAATVYNGDPWRPGIWAQFPISGAIAILICLGCIMANIIVLVVSDGQPTSQWHWSPTVLVALFTTGINLTTRFAFKQASQIAWWYRAVRGGTIEDLHREWSFGNGVWAPLRNPLHWNLIAVGSIAATIIVMDQPLMQRASNVVSITRSTPVEVTASIAPEIPWGYTAYQNGRSYTQQVMTQPMISVLNDFNNRNAINTTFSGCEESCTGYVDAAGFATKCTTVSGGVWYPVAGDIDAPMSPFNVNFSISLGYATSSLPGITLGVGYTNQSIDSSECIATRTERICSLKPATIRYPITLKKNILTLGDYLNDGIVMAIQPGSGSFTNVTFETDGGSPYSRWTAGGIYLAATNLYNSNATYTWGGAIGTYLTLPDTLSNQFLSFTGGSTSNISQEIIPEACSTNWTDPTPHILTSLNELAFRVSLEARDVAYRNTSSPPAAQRLTMNQSYTLNVYRSDYRYLAASTVITTLCTLLIVPVFRGWWRLGRHVSLNPIETAKAFDAPLLYGPGSNATQTRLIRVVGDRPVRLCDVDADHQHLPPGDPTNTSSSSRRWKLRFVDTLMDEGVGPRKGVRYE